MNQCRDEEGTWKLWKELMAHSMVKALVPWGNVDCNVVCGGG